MDIIITIINFLKTINYATLGNFLISGGLLAVVIIWVIDVIREKLFNKQLKNLLIEELKDNLLLLNEDIWWATNYGKIKKIPGYFLSEKVFNSLINSNKIIIFNKKVRNVLFDFYARTENIRNIISNPENSLISLIKKDKQFNYYIKILKNNKKVLKQVFILLEKGQIYDKLKLEGTEHQLKKEG